MTKKFLLELNMALVFIVVLFANVAYAAIDNTESMVKALEEQLKSFSGTSYYADIAGEMTQVKSSRKIIKLDANTLEFFKNNNVQLTYSYGVPDSYIYAQRLDKNNNLIGEKVTISFGSEAGFKMVRGNEGITKQNGENLTDGYSGWVDTSKDWVLTDSSLISQLKKDQKSLYFGMSREGENSSNLQFSYEGIDGNTQSVTPDETSDDNGIDYDVWGVNGTIKIDETKRYCFMVKNQGTFEVKFFKDGDDNALDPYSVPMICFVDSFAGNVFEAEHSGYRKKDDPTTKDDRCYVFSENDIYYFDVEGNTKISYTYLHDGISSDTESNTVSSNLKHNSIFEKIEKIFSDFVLSIARVLNWIVAMALGENVTIDMIVFNEYPDAKLEFFTTNIYGGDVETTSSLVASLRQPITTMYGIFRSLAIVGYLVILVYIGIKIMLSSTTAQKKAGYKETFLAWVMGLIILFFMPYYMKYTIALNDGLVNFVREIPSVSQVESQVTHATIDTKDGFVYTNFENAIDAGEGENAANDYMTTIYNLANAYGRLGYSIAYLVMSWQVIMLVVYYYKRAFIVALLIIIFPLIAFSYVWDKLNDGKSQALSSWIKEFTISVLVQAFHAVIFSFVVCTIYSSILNTTDGRGEANADFILLIIASKFLFEGEQILKQIFGGGGDVLGTAAQTGMKIAAVTRLTTSVVGRTVNNVVGKNGAVRTGWRSIQGLRRDALLLKNRPDGTKVFDLLASTPAKDRRTSALLPSMGEVTPNINRTAEMIDRLNNMHQNSNEVNAETLRMYRDLLDARLGKGPNAMTPEEAKQFDAMMKKSNLTKEQLDGLNASIMAATTAYVALGNNPTKEQTKAITKKLRMEIEAILPSEVDKNGNAKGGRNSMSNLMMEAALRNMRDGISSNMNPDNVDRYFDDTYENAKAMANRINFAKDDDIEKLANSAAQRRTRAKEIFRDYKKANGKMTKVQGRNARAMARNLAVIEQAFSGDKDYVVTSSQAAGAMRNIDNNRMLATAMMKHSKTDANIDSLRYLLAKKMTTEDTSISSDYSKTESIIENRTQAMYDSFVKRNAEMLTSVDSKKAEQIKENAREIVREYAYLEFAGTGVKDASINPEQLKAHLDLIASQDEELVEKMKEYSTLEYEISELRGDVSRLGGINWSEEPANEWAQDVVEQMESEASEKAKAFDDGSIGETDPYITIINIIEAAQSGLGSANIESLGELFTNASNIDARQKVTDRKKHISVAERIKSKELGEIGLRLEGYEYRHVDDFTSLENSAIANERERMRNRASNIRQAINKNFAEEKREIEKPTFEGYTIDEIKQRRNDNAWSVVNSTLGIVADTAIAPFTTLAGAAIGAAITDDGMPLEESFTGAMGGFKAGTFMSDKVIHGLTREDGRAEERAEIQKKIKKRINDEQKARYKAQQAAEEAAEEDARSLDNSLVVSGANAYLHIESDGTLSATVNVKASNAEYISIDETPVIPSSGWAPFQESVYYKFKDRDPSADHTLYIYVRDENGNVKGIRITGIHQ